MFAVRAHFAPTLLLVLFGAACSQPSTRHDDPRPDTAAPAADAGPPLGDVQAPQGDLPPPSDAPAADDSAPRLPGRQPPPDEATKQALQREYNELALKNVCPDGYRPMQGKWRFIGQTRTPEFEDVLELTGTRFVERLSGLEDGKRVEATLEGEIRCLFKNRVLFRVDRVVPEGAFGNQSGDVFPCDQLGTLDLKNDRILLICFFNWDLRPVAGKEYEYGRYQRFPPPKK